MRSSIEEVAITALDRLSVLPLSACVPLALRCPLPQERLRWFHQP
ncbi:hypothetical protein [Rufibacter roseus]|nr:hypothetical protein [Rufibacter roseus]